MASKWKYASLTADERIELLKRGKKDVFDEEIARTREIVKARRELGLDTLEQERWIDTLGYNYNLSVAEKAGEPVENVSKTGYAELYLGGKATSTGTPSAIGGTTAGIVSVSENKNTAKPSGTQITNARLKIKNAGRLAEEAIEKKYAQKRDELEAAFYGEHPYLREAVLNSGGHDEGGKMARAYRELADELGVALSGVSERMEAELSKSREKYAALADKILEYRKNGASKDSLGVIADVLIKNAALEDGYDAALLDGKYGGSNAEKGTAEESVSENADKGGAEGVKRAVSVTTVEGTKKRPEDEKTAEAGLASEEVKKEDEAVKTEDEAASNVGGRVGDIIRLARGGKMELALEILESLSGLDKETAARVLKLILAENA